MGGLKVNGHKNLAQTIIKGDLNPRFVYVTMQNGHIGKPATVAVKAGDQLLVGTLIGKAAEGISANVFSPVSGKVVQIKQMQTLGNRTDTVVEIENDFKNKKQLLPKLKKFDKESILARIKDAGIVGLGGAGFPTHIKFGTTAEIDTLILNGCECETYLTCDDLLMRNFAKEICKGGALLAKTLGLNKFTVVIESNKKEAITAMKEAAAIDGDVACTVKTVKTKYPMGAEKMLIKHVLNRVVPLGKLPSDVKVVVTNVATSFAVYNACVKNQPLYEKLVTISGKALNSAGNIWVKNGTLISDVITFMKGEKFDKAEIGYLERYADSLQLAEEDAFAAYMTAIADKKSKEEITQAKNEFKKTKKESRQKLKAKVKEINNKGKNILTKIIAGGSMGGESVESAQIPTNITTGGLLFLTPTETNLAEPTECINCKKCIKVCPMKLKPVEICESYYNKNLKKCASLNPGGCFVCGCCSFVCPARINLAQKIAQIKKEVK